MEGRASHMTTFSPAQPKKRSAFSGGGGFPNRIMDLRGFFKSYTAPWGAGKEETKGRQKGRSTDVITKYLDWKKGKKAARST